MKLISYFIDREERDQLAILVGDKAYNMNELDRNLPNNMNDFLWGEDEMMVIAKAYDAKIKAGKAVKARALDIGSLGLMSPVPYPSSCRDAYAFRQHVEAARQNRGLQMTAEFDQFPVFYFTNHRSIQGGGEVACMPDHLKGLDFELEVAVVIGMAGYNIRAEEADDFIAGFMIMNDLSARCLQIEEMKLNLGPAKGKDFATAVGPYLVTPDELKKYLVEPQDGHIGKNYDLEMQCKVNGKLVSTGNMKDMFWTFAEIIERVSYGTELLPGDIIGSGTVGTGCFLELNGTAKRLAKNPSDFKPQWLKVGDKVDMTITGLGELSNEIALSDDKFSILKRKINV